MQRLHCLLAFSVLVIGLTAPAMAQDGELADLVTFRSGGEYASYPPASVSRRGAATVYTIDMTTVKSKDAADGDPSVSMTWEQAQDAHVVCFEHDEIRVCRTFAASWSTDMSPRFIPTRSNLLPTIYVRFGHETGDARWIVYTAGEIITRDEEIERMRAGHPAPR